MSVKPLIAGASLIAQSVFLVGFGWLMVDLSNGVKRGI